VITQSRCRSRSGGMTLIEVLVALALLSLLSVGLVTAFSTGHRGYERILKMDRAFADVVTAQRFLRSALESVYPFQPDKPFAQPPRGIEGTADHLSMTAGLGIGDAAAGHRRYTFALVPRANGRSDLIATSRVDRNGAAQDDTSSAVYPETVVGRVASVEWAYYDATEGRVGWRNTWSERKPPALVRLRVAFPPGDSRVWPELIVAPRITDDANCQFDVVAQSCREVGP
jgi:general secretion pathway protein J